MKEVATAVVAAAIVSAVVLSACATVKPDADATPMLNMRR